MKIEGNVFIRTLSHYYTGRVVDWTEDIIVLAEAAWIADTGRFSQAMSTGVFTEVEPYPADWTVYVSRAAIVDFVPWPHELPREVK